MMEAPSFVFITSNVGSLFGCTKELQTGWISETVRLIEEKRPDVLAIHFQEVGGKNFAVTMGEMKPFINELYSLCSSKFGLNRGIAYVDENNSVNNEFTALGCLYLFGRTLPSVYVYNFATKAYCPVELFETCTNGDGLPFFQKRRFLKTMFIKGNPSRKGFLRVRLKVHALEFDLVNVHLFHDSCNLTAVEMSPSVFAKQRRFGLEFVFDEMQTLLPGTVPLIIFGDFNFRLDTKCLVEEVLAPSSVAVQTVTRGEDGKPIVLYKHVESGQNLLDVRTKVFNHTMCLEPASLPQLFQLDREPKNYHDLREFPVTFLPSYPFVEDSKQANVYTNTRAPAWCDRVFLNNQAWQLSQSIKQQVDYDLLGKDTCMGDHKPVYLCIRFPLARQHTDVLGNT